MVFSLNKIKHFIQPLMVAVIGAIFWSACSPSKEYSAELTMESDAMSVVNYYIPKRIELSDTPLEANLVLPELKSNNPRFGSIVMGKGSDALISIVLDEVRDKSNKIISSDLYVDKNNNEDLTDDGEANWDDDKKTYFMKEVLIDVNYTDDSQIAVPYPVNFYRYKHRLENSVVAFRNGYRKGTIALKDTTYKIAIFDDDLNGLFNERDRGAIVIDSNRDGTLNGESGSGEYFSLRSHFDINGTTYKIKEISPSGNLIKLASVNKPVPVKQPILTDQQAPAFRAIDTNGEVVDLINYKNKVVLLDFWATWCQPWESNLKTLKKNYDRYNDRGFEIIGMNLDHDLDIFQNFVTTHEIKWPQIWDGKGWDMSLAERYNINSLPKNYLLDRNGIIRYKDLHGKNLEAKIYELLNEPLMEN